MNVRLALAAASALVAGSSLAGCHSKQIPLFGGGPAAPFVEPADDHPMDTTPRAYVRYIPERVDDIAWENDRVAFRIYGPELETAAPPMTAGIDAWGKKVVYPIINRWYGNGEYHVDHGEGADMYKTGASRGAGGIGVWDASTKKLYTSRDWSSYSIIDRGPKQAKFQVTYAPWRIAEPPKKPDSGITTGRKVWQVTTITLPRGSDMNHIETTMYSNEPGDITIAIGLASHGAADGVLWQDAATGRMTYWDKADVEANDKTDNGYMGTAVIAPPAIVTGFAKTDTDNLMLVKVTPGKPFVYYAGACWSKGMVAHTSDGWDHIVKSFWTDFGGAVKGPE